MLFTVFIHDLDIGIQCILRNFANDTKLEEAEVLLKDRVALQEDLDRVRSWVITNCIKFDKSQLLDSPPQMG